MQACRTAGISPRHPLEMVLWAHEESTAFGRGTAASRIVSGDLQAGDLDQVWNGLRRADAIRRIGGDPDRIEQAVRRQDARHAYFELHIEQGGTLENPPPRSASSKASSRSIVTMSPSPVRESRGHHADERAARRHAGGIAAGDGRQRSGHHGTRADRSARWDGWT